MYGITRGTTPHISIILPCGIVLADIAALYITIQQGATVITKTLSDVTETQEGVLACTLTQVETLSLSYDTTVKVQVRLRTVSGEAIASETITTTVGEILRDGEI